MRVGRTLPPAAAPIGLAQIVSGFCGVVRGQKSLDRFRSELKECFGVRHCFLVCSGRAALSLILLALEELSPNRKDVIIPAFSCFSVPSSVVRARLKLSLCDLDPDSLDFNFTQLSSMLHDTRELLAIVPTHLFGAPSDVPRLRRLSRDSGVAIVEDAAQAMGESCKGRKLGTLGDVGFFSLGRGKAFSTVEGGVILTDRDDIAEVLGHRVESLPGYGFRRQLKLILNAIGLMLFIHPRLFWIPRLLPFLRLGATRYEPNFPIVRMTPFQAGLASGWQRRIEDLRNARAKAADRWHAILHQSDTHRPCIRAGDATGLLRFPIRVLDKDRRELLLRESDRRGLGVMPVYPTSIDAVPELREMIKLMAFPVANGCAREIVTLPTHGYVSERDFAELQAVVQR